MRRVGWLLIPVYFLILLILFGTYKYVQRELNQIAASQGNPPDLSTVGFNVVSKARIRAGTDFSLFWILHRRKEGERLSPIPDVQFVQFNNLKPIPVMIDSYSVETEIVGGQWIKVHSIDLREGKVFFVRDGSDFKNASPVDLADFNSLIDNKSVGPHDTIQGWMLFDMPTNGFGKNWRMRIKETSGKQFTELFQVDKDADDFEISAGNNGTRLEYSGPRPCSASFLRLPARAKVIAPS
jgi:hypothetical protein